MEDVVVAGQVYSRGPCVVSVYRLPSCCSGGECDVLCPLLLASAARSLGMCGRASTPTWAETPERRGPWHSHRELVWTPEREGWTPFLFLCPPRSGRCCAGIRLWTSGPRAWGHVVLPSQQALSSTLRPAWGVSRCWPLGLPVGPAGPPRMQLWVLSPPLVHVQGL